MYTNVGQDDAFLYFPYIHLGSTLAYFDRWPFSIGFDPSFRDSDVKLKTEGKMNWRSSCQSEKVENCKTRRLKRSSHLAELAV